jgi:hypothetical protein
VVVTAGFVSHSYEHDAHLVIEANQEARGKVAIGYEWLDMFL